MHSKLKLKAARYRLEGQKTMKKFIGKKDCKEEDQALIEFNGQLPTIEQLTQLLMTEAMKRANGNKSIAAEMLGIPL
jgi:hypothetical protein